ncbi:uncharacterized protein HMPREF1541_08818 [Cyphellophora europaea CBS 101466]|uniref:Phosphatidic acid phosphatase type 2/haloperoxidase domain-containing protein n=1 Tax=Cyphellophora europaea (strain CBS 101466) TaxID=1220924 RepID=W2RJL7_CYPE1|nr:uncharacterized protein HMPREF1541_08818 [Cyphellophora europaea CBS 101466]ETN36540.1 hypothetical protein HMPREF1541_08818 [Cyphellophora europaea CBS 101466]
MVTPKIRVVVTYLIDWMVIVIVAAAGGSLSFVDGYRRPFALTDEAIAYPSKPDIVPFSVVAAVALLVPLAIIAALTFGSPTDISRRSIRKTLRERLWITNAGWSGLCLSVAAALLVTEGLKTIVGKPRPDMLAVCHADLTNITRYEVGGVGSSLESEAPILVSASICRQSDQKKLRDAFSAFPSGHSSFSWAGLLYLSLWLCAKLSARLPYLGHYQLTGPEGALHHDAVSRSSRQASAPPLWLVAVAMFPVGTALFISASRYADFHHAGIDIVAGAVIGIITAWYSFRLYHLPVRRGFGMPWGFRSDQIAFTGALPWTTEGSEHVADAGVDVEAEAQGTDMRTWSDGGQAERAAGEPSSERPP